MTNSTPTDADAGDTGIDAGLAVFRLRMKQAMGAKGLNQKQLAAQIGRTEDTISRIMRGHTQYRTPRLLKDIATELGVTSEWLLGQGPAESVATKPILKPTASTPKFSDITKIPVIGFVQAGAYRPVTEHFDEQTVRWVNAARHERFQPIKHFAMEVVGDSVDQLGISSGDTIICVDWIDSGMAPITGLLVVVERTINSGHLREWTVKQMEVQEDRVILHPRSSNASHKPIEIIHGDHDNGEEIKIIGLVVNVIKNLFKL